MTDIQMATLAGFFAGECSISISGGKWPTLYAQLGNSELLWSKMLYDNFGGCLTIEGPTKKFPNAKYMFRWRTSGRKAVAFLKAIEPYLIGEKANQLKLGLEFQQLKESEHSTFKYSNSLLDKMQVLQRLKKDLRSIAAETNRRDAQQWRCDSPIPSES